MSAFQLLLFVIAGFVFYIFYKQLTSGDYPKRGVDFEEKKSPESIGGITEPGKMLSKPIVNPTRMQELIEQAERSIESNELSEAKRALQSALILNADDTDALMRSGYVELELGDFENAKDVYGKLLELDESNDLAHTSMANTLQKLGNSSEAIVHHKRAIEIDSGYAKHYYNYANTLHDAGEIQEALVQYQKAYELDDTLDVAKEMITKLQG